MEFVILTASYNKKWLAVEAIDSIVKQTYPYWTLRILENSTDNVTRRLVDAYVTGSNDIRINFIPRNYTSARREKSYIVADWINENLDVIRPDQTFMWISDDDVWYPNMLEEFSKEISNYDALYCGVLSRNMRTFETSFLTQGQLMHKQNLPDCQIDGGSVAVKGTILQDKNIRFDSKWGEHTGHCDGLFLNKVVEVTPIVPINKVLMEHRTFPHSNFAQS